MIKNRFIGSMLGLAIGDAMGMASEFLTKDIIKDKYGRIENYQKPQPGLLTSSLLPGQYTDDTQMALAQLEAILEKGYFCPFTTANYFKVWGTSIECRTPGKACLAAAKSLAIGVPWWMSGQSSAGCGAAMRIAPLALYHFNSMPHEIIKDTVSASIITHTDSRGVMGAVIVALSIHYCIREEKIDPNNLIDYLKAQIKPFDQTFDSILDNVLVALPLDEESAFSILGNGGFVLETVSAALYCFLKSPKDFEKTILTAVNGGNDADSVAAIAGAISGAFNGKSNIPSRFIQGLENHKLIENKTIELFDLCKMKGSE